ncbi:hypothetical protein EV126DRAFT_457926 [Verticillium dahliae]|nr:hypothetical protein EV126DRAFT_457926 [Verticillium dahliae]
MIKGSFGPMFAGESSTATKPRPATPEARSLEHNNGSSRKGQCFTERADREENRPPCSPGHQHRMLMQVRAASLVDQASFIRPSAWYAVASTYCDASRSGCVSASVVPQTTTTCSSSLMVCPSARQSPPPSASRTSTRRRTCNTGFREPFNRLSNTTLTQPEANLADNAVLSQDDLSFSERSVRQRYFLLRRRKHVITHGIIRPAMEVTPTDGPARQGHEPETTHAWSSMGNPVLGFDTSKSTERCRGKAGDRAPSRKTAAFRQRHAKHRRNTKLSMMLRILL